jgi:intein/homing endonuclease
MSYHTLAKKFLHTISDYLFFFVVIFKRATIKKKFNIEIIVISYRCIMKETKRMHAFIEIKKVQKRSSLLRFIQLIMVLI